MQSQKVNFYSSEKTCRKKIREEQKRCIIFKKKHTENIHTRRSMVFLALLSHTIVLSMCSFLRHLPGWSHRSNVLCIIFMHNILLHCYNIQRVMFLMEIKTHNKKYKCVFLSLPKYFHGNGIQLYNLLHLLSTLLLTHIRSPVFLRNCL